MLTRLVVVYLRGRRRYPAADFEHFLGRPAATYRVASWLVLVYRTNLLGRILPRPGPY